jgi:hypothetical protein
MRKVERQIPVKRTVKGSPKASAPNADRVAVLLVILIAVGVAYLIVQSRSRQRQDIVAGGGVAPLIDLSLASSGDGETKIETLGLVDEPVTDASTASPLETALEPALEPVAESPEEKILSAAMDAGMFFVPLDLKNGGIIKVSLLTQGGAEVGIVNGILSDIGERRLGRVIMSLEAIANDRQKNPLTAGTASNSSPRQLLTEGEITNGARLSFAVPPISRPAQAGIFICGDQSGSGTCLGKEPFTAQGILADRYTSFYNPSGEFVFPARIYYFAYVVLTPVGFFVMSQVSEGTESYSAIGKFLAALSVEDAGALTQVQALNAKSQSQQPAIVEGGLQIELSRGLQ